MKNLFLSISLLFILFSCSSGPKTPGAGIQFFTGNFDAAVTEAAKQNKPVFIYGHTSWCGFCKKMNRTTFLEKEVDDYMNKTFINLSYDLEKGEGIYIAGKYSLKSFPAYVILDASGELVGISGGYMDTSKFLAWIKGQTNS